MENCPLILIAEDDNSNYRYLEVVLRKRYRLLRAQNGQEAVTLALECGPDLVLMDNKMPVMNGVEALREIKRHRPDLPIVMQTAFAFDSDRRDAMEAGADDYLTKPIMSRALNDILARLLS